MTHSKKMRFGGVTCEMEGVANISDLALGLCEATRFQHVVTLNPEMVVRAESDEAFRTAVERAERRLPDGSGLVWAHRYLTQPDGLCKSLWAFLKDSDRSVPGVELMVELAGQCVRKKEGFFLLGGSESDNAGAVVNLKKRYPTLRIEGLAGFEMNDSEILKRIQNVAPLVLAVAYGAPKQTLWLEAHRSALSDVRVAIGVGGAVSMLAGRLPRAPRAWRNRHVEWLWRWWLEPARAYRIWNATGTFIWLIWKQKRSSI